MLQPPAARPEPGPVRIDAPIVPLPPQQGADAHAGTFVAVAPRRRSAPGHLDPRLPLQRAVQPPQEQPAELRPARARSAAPTRSDTGTCSAGTTPTTPAIDRASGRPGPARNPARRWPCRWSPTRRPTRTSRGSSTATAPTTSRRGQNVLYSDGSGPVPPDPPGQPHRQRPLPQQPARAPAWARRARRRARAELLPHPGIRAVSRDSVRPTSRTRKRRMMKCSFACASGLWK